MPKAKEFVAAFGLAVGAEIGGYRLTNVQATESVVKRYQEYSYAISLRATKTTGTTASFRSSLQEITSQEKIVYGVRNPYLCTIDPEPLIISEGTEILAMLTGHAHRRY